MEQRRQARVPFSCSARLLTESGGAPIAAQIQNLSATGLFLTADAAPQKGSPVRCRFRLGKSPRDLQGRVAWVQRLRGERNQLQAGAGIEFVSLNDSDRHLLEELTQDPDDRNQAPLEPLTVWFEGLTAPVKTQGRIGPDEIVVTTQLPFLRIGSDVKVGLTGASGQHHRYARIDGLALDFLHPNEPPRIVVRLRAAETLREAGELSSALRSRGEAFSGSNPTPQPETNDPADDAGYDSFELSSPPRGALTPPPHLLETRAQPAPSVPAPPTPRTLAAMPPPSVFAAPHTPLLVPPPASASTSAPAPKLTPKVWGLVAAIAVLMVVWLLIPGGPLSPDAVQVDPKDMLERTPEQSALPMPSGSLPDVTPLPSAPVDPAPVVVADLPPLQRFTRAPFRLQRHADSTVVIVPVLGPSSPSEVLRLAPQPGVVAILPRARLPRNQGLFLVRDPVIDRVAVEARPLGIYVRVLFGNRANGYKIEHSVGELRVIVSHK